MASKIQFRRDSATNWTNTNPVLAQGEPGIETDTLKIKYGDGSSNWVSLPYAGLAIGTDGQITIGNGTTTNGGPDSIAIGTDAGIGQSWSTVALGNNAGNSDQSPSAIAIGRSAGNSNQDWDAIAIGRRAGQTDQQEGTIAIGYYAGQTNQRYHSIAIGSQAGQTNQYWDAIAIGKGAGNYGQDHQTIAIGHRAGETDQVAQSIAIGAYAGNNTQGMHAIAIGARAGNDSQGWAAVAIGEDAGNNAQGFRGIAVGRLAGNDTQGNQAIAVGALAGYNEQGNYSIAMGRHAGEGSQGAYAIAIGQEAGRGANPNTIEGAITANQVSGGATGEFTMVLDSVNNIYAGMFIGGYGLNALVTDVNRDTNTITFDTATVADASGQYVFFGSQGDYAIAIGAYASSIVQHSHSIVINATGDSVISASPNSFVVKPVAQGATANSMYYDSTTGEITYSNVPSIVAKTTSPSNTIEIDLTKSVNKLTATGGGSTANGNYHLADGTEGQILYLVPAGGTVSNEYTGINIDNYRYRNLGDNTIYEGTSGNYWLPFVGQNATVITLIFTDGHWNIPHNSFD
jgi:Major tropism determinant N-terminal domain